MKAKISNSFQKFKAPLFIQSLVALVLAAPSVASAIEIKDTNYQPPNGAFYVSPTGKNSNSGKSPSSAWPLQKALSSAPAGATIVFRGGTYRTSGNFGKKLTLQAYPREKAWLKGSVVVSDWVADGGKWRKDNWKYGFPRNMGSEYLNPKYPLAGNRDMVYINGQALKQVGDKAKVGPGTFYVDYRGNKLYIGSNPRGKTVEATAIETGLTMWRANGSTIKGLGFAHYADRGLLVGAANVTLENNTFAWNGIQGVMTTGNANNIIRGNTFSYNGRGGLRASHADNLLLENNTISHNNIEHFAITWDANGAKITESDGVVARNNIVENNLSTGLWLDKAVTNAKVVHNIARNNDVIGIFFEISHKAIIASNVSHNNGIGIMVSNASNAKVYNNTLANNNRNLWIKDTKRVNTNRSEVARGVTGKTRDNVIKNNILSNTNGGPFLEAANCDTKERSTMMISAADSNAYYRKSSRSPKSVTSWSLGSSNCKVKYSSIAAFKSATGFEKRALWIDNTATNPFFVNAERGDYRLKSGSPAINHGEPLPADVAAAIGVKAGVRLNLGAK